MTDHISTIFLLLGIINGAVVAPLLLMRSSRTQANWILALFISLLLTKVIIYILGKEQLFDPFSWLYVPPLELSLAFGPCAFLYVTYLVHRRYRPKDLVHFVPVVLQVLYYLVLLMTPPQQSREWVAEHHLGWAAHTETLLTLVSLTTYLLLSWRLFFVYQDWLDKTQSDAENYRLRWVKAFLGITSVYSVVWAGVSFANLWQVSSYESHFLLFAAMSLLLFFLSLESWRHTHLIYPQMHSDKGESNEADHATAAEATLPKTINNAAQATQNRLLQAWHQEVNINQCWKEPKLTLTELAKRLGTNATTLSFVLNQANEENFNAAINRMRIDYVCERLQSETQGMDFLSLAMEAGFNSKNSFNRNFKRFTGMTPTEFSQASTKS